MSFGLRPSDFGLLSGFGLRSSDFRAAEHDLPSTGRTSEQPWPPLAPLAPMSRWQRPDAASTLSATSVKLFRSVWIRGHHFPGPHGLDAGAAARGEQGHTQAVGAGGIDTAADGLAVVGENFHH